MRPHRVRIDPADFSAAAGGLLLLAAALVLWPVDTQVPPRRISLADRGDSVRVVPAAPRASIDGLSQQVVNANLFSRSRRAPTVRFQLPGLSGASAAGESGAPMAGGGAAGAPSMPSPSVSDELVLLGLVERHDGPQALIGRAAGDSAAQIVGIGGRVGSYRVRAIGRDRVILDSPSGSRIMRLTRPSPSDSSQYFP